MTSLVLQLQADCLDAGVSILEILRKALVVARKLSLDDAQAWIERELNGYKSGDTPPPHRLLTVQIKARDPYQGMIPVIFLHDSKAAKMLSTCFLGQSVGTLEDLVRNGGDTSLAIPFDPETERQIMSGLSSPSQPMRFVSKAAVAGIIHAVRNMVLDWCLTLEKDGILGEGLMFSIKEKEAAAHASFTINYLGPVGQSQIQQGSDQSTQSMSVAGMDLKSLAQVLDSLKGNLAELQLGTTDSAQLHAEVQTVEAQIASPRPNHFVVRQSLQSIRNILEGCAGSLLASGLMAELGKLLQ